METIEPPNAGSDVSEQALPVSSSTSSAVDDLGRTAGAADAAPYQLADKQNPASAVIFQLATYAGLKNAETSGQAKPKSGTPSAKELVIIIFDATIRNMAALKNVAIPPEVIPALAAGLARALDTATARNLVKGTHSASRSAAILVNRLLDTIAAKNIISIIWRGAGFENLDEAWLTAQAMRWTEQGIAPQNEIDNRFWWPDPNTMITDYVAACTGCDASVVVPDHSTVRVAWFLDPARYREGVRTAPTNAAKPSGLSPLARLPQSVPQLIRCPNIPGTPGFRFPDGRCVRVGPNDGVTVTTWWKDNRLHRDPKEGPAKLVTDGTRTWMEFRVKGQLHRPHGEGPALIDSHYEGQEISSEEYFEHGVWHRPSSEGPAVRRVDRAGNFVCEIYVEQGKRHRDAAAGPAWRGIEDGCFFEEYCHRGSLHRNEQDGPAVIGCDATTGVRREERYYRDNRLHRENGPAATYSEPDCTVIESWYQNGALHRDPTKGPAVIMYDADGLPVRIAFYSNGECCASPAGPTEITFYSPNRRCEEYWQGDKLHRDPSEGPAVIWRDETGAITETAYWVNGAQITPAGDNSAPSNPSRANRRARRAAQAVKKVTRKARRGRQ